MRDASSVRALSVIICNVPGFNAAALLEEYGDQGLVRELAQLLVDTTPSQLEAIRTALQSELEDNPYYRHAIAVGQLAPVEVALLDCAKGPAWTIYECWRLEQGQNKVERLESKAQADGTVTPAEKRRLEQAQDVQNKRIYRQKHDAQVKPR